MNLQQIPCFQRIEPRLLRRIRQRAGEKRLPKGALLVRRGSVLDKIVLVIEGRLKMYQVDHGGSHRTLRILGPGDCFCLAPGHLRRPSPVTIECLNDSRLFLVEAGSLRPMALQEGSFTQAVMRCLLSRTVEAMPASREMAHRPVRQRIAAALMDLGRRHGSGSAEGMLIEGLTHEELAAYAGTVREVASRNLKRLEREGLLTTGRMRILIHSPERLGEIVGER